VLPASRRRGVVRAALELSQMAGKTDVRAGSLGLLDLKRLELARVLALDPEVILLDEVAAGLTGKDLDDLIELVAAIRDQGRTLVVVEHVQDVLHRLAERVVVLEWGEKLLEGTPAEVSEDPRVIEIYLGAPSHPVAPAPRAVRDSTAPLLEVSSLRAGYGPITVLSDLSLTVGPGEVVAVLGANGAGKSTLARAIQGTIPSRGGSIAFGGHDVTRRGAAHRLRAGIALVPEGRRLFGPLSVRDNLELGLRGRDTSPLDKVYQLFPRLIELADRQAGHLSGGEQQMVAIGRAMASEPRLIIFDELSLGLAPIIVDRMLEAVKTISSWGTSVLLIEQNVHRALALSDRAVLMRRGAVAFDGHPSDLSDEKFRQAYLGLDSPT